MELVLGLPVTCVLTRQLSKLSYFSYHWLSVLLVFKYTSPFLFSQLRAGLVSTAVTAAFMVIIVKYRGSSLRTT